MTLINGKSLAVVVEMRSAYATAAANFAAALAMPSTALPLANEFLLLDGARAAAAGNKLLVTIPGRTTGFFGFDGALDRITGYAQTGRISHQSTIEAARDFSLRGVRFADKLLLS